MIRIQCKCGREMELIHPPEGGVVMCSGCLSEVSVPQKKEARIRVQTPAPARNLWITCKKCRNSFARPTRYVGRKMRCPVCAKGLRVSKKQLKGNQTTPLVKTQNPLRTVVMVGAFFLVPGVFALLVSFVGWVSDIFDREEASKKVEPTGYTSQREPVQKPRKPVSRSRKPETRPPTPTHSSSHAKGGYDHFRMKFDPSSLVRKIRSRQLSEREWEQLSAPTRVVHAKRQVVLTYPRNRGTHVLLVPCPKDKWHAKNGRVSEYPWVDHAGLRSRTWKGLPFMALCWSSKEAGASIHAVSRAPLIDARGEIILFPNDGILEDNQGHIRVKILELEQKPRRTSTHQ